MLSQHGTRNKHMKVVHGTPIPSRDNTGFDKKCPHCNKRFIYDFSMSYHIESRHFILVHKKPIKLPKRYLLCLSPKFVLKFSNNNIHWTAIWKLMKTMKALSVIDALHFSRHDNLVKHEKRIHSIANINVSIIRKSNMTEFTCKMCGRNFRRDIGTFEAHLMPRLCRQIDKDNLEVDSNLKFVCDQCDKTYAEKDSLDRHIRWKHRSPMELFKCSQCDSTFKLKSSLARHSRRVHNGT